jgi:hypothetical protein
MIENKLKVQYYYKTKNHMTTLNNEALDQYVSSYENTFKLPATKIPCSTDNCTTLTTMFGTNLHKRVVKYGNIRTLLTTFECKQCRAKAKAHAIIAQLTKTDTALAVVE